MGDNSSNHANNPKLTLEKLRINERLLMIEQYIVEGKDQRAQLNNTMSTINIRMVNIENKILGDPKSTEKKYRDGMERRLENCEILDADSEKVKGNLLKVAVGSLTMAIGAFVIWACKMFWTGIGKG